MRKAFLVVFLIKNGGYWLFSSLLAPLDGDDVESMETAGFIEDMDDSGVEVDKGRYASLGYGGGGGISLP